MSTPQHQRTFGPQAAYRGTPRTPQRRTFVEQLGTPEAIERAADAIEDTGETAATAGQVALEHSAYLFSLTPLPAVDQALRAAPSLSAVRARSGVE